MCTVTFLPRDQGYCLAMNRDERLDRPAGLPPRRYRARGRLVLHPSEPGGGTWISVNDAGVALSLVNWYAVQREVGPEAVSRGEVIRTAQAAVTPEDVEAALRELALDRINPFRLAGVFPAIRAIREWRWDLERLVVCPRPWTARQWTSSGYDEARAQAVRGRTFRRAQRQLTAGTLDWLRRLHGSHHPEAGPFSICMHRADAATVSYTEIVVSAHRVTMRYSPMGGSPVLPARGDRPTRHPCLAWGAHAARVPCPAARRTPFQAARRFRRAAETHTPAACAPHPFRAR